MSTALVTLLTLILGLFVGLGLGIYIGRIKNGDSSQSLAVIKTLQAQLDEARKRENESTRLDEALKDVKERMHLLTTKTQEAEVKRAAADSEIRTQIENMRTGNESLVSVATKLEGALSNSQARGKYGEVQLELILEKSGLIEGVHYERQSTAADGNRPDITINLPGGSQIFIDSKFPFQRFLEAIDEKDDSTRADLMKAHASDLMKHVNELHKREYQGVTNSPDFVVLFAPFESILYETLKAEPQFLNNVFEKNVTVATPTNMMALLKSVNYAFGRHDLARNAADIQDLATEFLKRVGSLHTKLSTLGDRLKSTERAFNDAVATAETTLLRPARKMADLGVSKGNAKLLPIAEVDDEVRTLKGATIEIDYIDADEVDSDGDEQ